MTSYSSLLHRGMRAVVSFHIINVLYMYNAEEFQSAGLFWKLLKVVLPYPSDLPDVHIQL